MADTLTINRRGPNTFCIRCGDRWESQLTWDEALGVAARFLIEADGVLPYLSTKEQHQARADKYRKSGNFTEEELLRMVEP